MVLGLLHWERSAVKLCTTESGESLINKFIFVCQIIVSRENVTG